MSQIMVSPVNGFINFTPDGVFFDSVAAIDALAYIEVSGSLPASVVIGGHSHVIADITDFPDMPICPPSISVCWFGSDSDAQVIDLSSIFLSDVQYSFAGQKVNLSNSASYGFYGVYPAMSAKYMYLTGGYFKLFTSPGFSFNSSTGLLSVPANTWLNDAGCLYVCNFQRLTLLS